MSGPWRTGTPPWGDGPPPWISGNRNNNNNRYSEMNVTLDDSSPEFVYSNWAKGTNSWSARTGDSQYHEGTYHTTSGVDDQFDIIFEGTAIYIYGAKHGDPAGFTAYRIDRGPPLRYTEPAIEATRQLLVAVTGLSPTEQHQFNWAANVGVGGTTFDIDYAVITSSSSGLTSSPQAGTPTCAVTNSVSSPSTPLPSVQQSSTPSTASPSSTSSTSIPSSISAQVSTGSTQSSTAGGGNSQVSGTPRFGPSPVDNANPISSTDSSSSTNIGAIAGGVAGGVVALAIIAFLLWWFFCRRKRQSEQRVDPLVEPKPLDLAEGGASPGWALPTYAQSQGVLDNVAGSVYYTSPVLGPGESRSFSPASDHPFLSPSTAPHPMSHASYPYSVNPPSTAASSEADPEGYRSPFWSGMSPPATPSSRQGAASRAASVPESATSRYSHLQRSEKSPSSLPYRNSHHSTPATLVPSNAGSTSTNQSYKKLYQKWTERNREGESLKE